MTVFNRNLHHLKVVDNVYSCIEKSVKPNKDPENQFPMKNLG